MKKKKLHELMLLTARAFQTKAPAVRGLSFDECLKIYAEFTKQQSELCINSGVELEHVKRRLYQNAYGMAKRMRKSYHLKTWQDRSIFLSLLYGLIEVDFRILNPDEFVVNKCFFSNYYKSEVCKLISSLDEGLAAGFGGKLCFTQRMTEGDGHSCCTGRLKQED